MKANLSIKEKKETILQALRKSAGILTIAIKQANVMGRTQFYQYLNDDPDFKAEVDEINEIMLDRVETQLLQKLQQGDNGAMFFYLKTKGKSRGYSEYYSRK